MVGHTGDSLKRWAPSPSPARPRRDVTFKESSPEMKEPPSASEGTQSAEANDSPPLSRAPKVTRADPLDWSQPKEEDLGGLPILDPHVAEFLSGEG